ncbi:MAG: twin-arginine translocation signal domain-containing protein [Bacteroidota bacterium]
MMDRRDFLLRSALGAAGLGLAAGPAHALAEAVGVPVAGATGPGGLAASVSLASRVAIADALHLAAADETIASDVRAALLEFPQQLVAADAVPATRAETAALLGELRALWPDRDDRPHDRSGTRGDMAEQRLAWAAGRLAHDAAASVLGTPSADEARARDGQLLRALHATQTAPVPASGADAAALADVFRVIHQRTNIRFHTYAPDREDPVGWSVRLSDWDRARGPEADRLAEAVLSGRDDAAFLDPSDAAFRLARTVRQARAVPAGALDRLAEAPGASAYAQAVGAAFVAMRGVGRFFAGHDDALDR